tara:strand:- start:1982 stop:2476 length:495 start_codon:yes stop_codon:yes gene_type:complete
MRIILCPGSAENQKFKRWPITKFNQLGKELLALDHDTSIVLGPEEAYLSSSFSEFKIEQSLSFQDLMAKGLTSDLVICNDSFLLHFFSFIEVATLALYGPTDPLRTLPPNAYMITSKRRSSTKPCWGNKNYGKCSHGICSCFEGLEVEDVIKKISKILNYENIF